MKDNYILTAESVTAGHPDKLCDTIADSILDACLKEDPNARVACEVLATAGKILVAGELHTTAHPDVETIVRQAVQRAGYDCNYHVEVRLHTQSPDIAGAVDGDTLGAGDQGIMYGYACWETVELLPAPVVLANRITSLLTTCREEKLISGIGPDGKAQVSVQYAFGVPERVDTMQEQIYEIEDGLMELRANNAERFTIKSLEKTKKSLEVKLKKLQDTSRKDDVITFEQLGVDRLYVDEAHAFKNLFLYTKMRNVAGLSTTDAQKSSDMLLKCRYIDEITGNKGIVFATGTPVSNSMTELYTMMRYLQHDMLQRKHLTHFDCWASTFGETATAIELAPEGTGYRARTRFSKFFNLPELMQLFKEAADIKTADQLHLPTPTPIYHNVVAQPTEIQKGMVQELSERAAKVHAGIVDASTDNMLKITSDGRKLGLDQRVINPDLPDEAGSKVNLCVDNIYSVWKDGQADKLTQLVFCDRVAIRCYK